MEHTRTTESENLEIVLAKCSFAVNNRVISIKSIIFFFVFTSSQAYRKKLIYSRGVVFLNFMRHILLSLWPLHAFSLECNCAAFWAVITGCDFRSWCQMLLGIFRLLESFQPRKKIKLKSPRLFTSFLLPRFTYFLLFIHVRFSHGNGLVCSSSSSLS